MSRALVPVVAAACALLPRTAAAQELTGTLVGTVRDEQGAVVAGADVLLTSPTLIGGPARTTTNDRGQLRFPSLPPGSYALDAHGPGLAPYREAGIRMSRVKSSRGSRKRRSSSGRRLREWRSRASSRATV